MSLEPVLIIIGSFLSLLMMLNAFFTRKTLEKITDVELKLAVLIANHDNVESRVTKTEYDILELRERSHKTINDIGGRSVLNSMEIENLKAGISLLAKQQ